MTGNRLKQEQNSKNDEGFSLINEGKSSMDKNDQDEEFRALLKRFAMLKAGGHHFPDGTIIDDIEIPKSSSNEFDDNEAIEIDVVYGFVRKDLNVEPSSCSSLESFLANLQTKSSCSVGKSSAVSINTDYDMTAGLSDTATIDNIIASIDYAAFSFLDGNVIENSSTRRNHCADCSSAASIGTKYSVEMHSTALNNQASSGLDQTYFSSSTTYHHNNVSSAVGDNNTTYSSRIGCGTTDFSTARGGDNTTAYSSTVGDNNTDFSTLHDGTTAYSSKSVGTFSSVYGGGGGTNKTFSSVRGGSTYSSTIGGETDLSSSVVRDDKTNYSSVGCPSGIGILRGSSSTGVSSTACSTADNSTLFSTETSFAPGFILDKKDYVEIKGIFMCQPADMLCPVTMANKLKSKGFTRVNPASSPFRAVLKEINNSTTTTTKTGFIPKTTNPENMNALKELIAVVGDHSSLEADVIPWEQRDFASYFVNSKGVGSIPFWYANQISTNQNKEQFYPLQGPPSVSDSSSELMIIPVPPNTKESWSQCCCNPKMKLGRLILPKANLGDLRIQLENARSVEEVQQHPGENSIRSITPERGSTISQKSSFGSRPTKTTTQKKQSQRGCTSNNISNKPTFESHELTMKSQKEEESSPYGGYDKYSKKKLIQRESDDSTLDSFIFRNHQKIKSEGGSSSVARSLRSIFVRQPSPSQKRNNFNNNDRKNSKVNKTTIKSNLLRNEKNNNNNTFDKQPNSESQKERALMAKNQQQQRGRHKKKSKKKSNFLKSITRSSSLERFIRLTTTTESDSTSMKDRQDDTTSFCSNNNDGENNEEEEESRDPQNSTYCNNNNNTGRESLVDNDNVIVAAAASATVISSDKNKRQSSSSQKKKMMTTNYLEDELSLLLNRELRRRRRDINYDTYIYNRKQRAGHHHHHHHQSGTLNNTSATTTSDCDVSSVCLNSNAKSRIELITAAAARGSQRIRRHKSDWH